jgi:C4-dicarboxylate-specific signal transduction histidine kinase
VQGLAETEMCLPYTIEKLHQSIDKVNLSNQELASAREALKQSEKLAHMGQLSAGIAHELNNPLGVITLYSNLLLDEIADDTTKTDLKLIVEQAERWVDYSILPVKIRFGSHKYISKSL